MVIQAVRQSLLLGIIMEDEEWERKWCVPRKVLEIILGEELDVDYLRVLITVCVILYSL